MTNRTPEGKGKSKQRSVPATTPVNPDVAVPRQPPPINWDTRPTLHRPIDSCVDELVAIYVLPEHVPQVQALLSSFGNPYSSPALTSSNIPADVQPHDTLDGHDPAPSFDDFPDVDPDILDAFDKLSFAPAVDSAHAGSFSTQERLAVSNWASLITPPPATSLAHRLQTSSINYKFHRYYAILVGKVTGVFWEEWDTVRPYVNSVPGAAYRSFKIEEDASRYYQDAKMDGGVCVVRNPGDSLRFGPLSLAMQ